MTRMPMMPLMKKAALAAALTVLSSASALAATYTTNGDTTAGPNFRRPNTNNLALLSNLGTAVGYLQLDFTVDQTGSYTLGAHSTFDNVAYLYSPSFAAANGLTNLLAGVDGGGTGLDAQFSATLNAGQSYVLIGAGYENGFRGAMSLTISGAGNISPVPEPQAAALLLAGLLAVGALARRRGSVAAAQS